MQDQSQNQDPHPPTDPRLLRLTEQDNVAMAATALQSGQPIVIDGVPVVLSEDVPTGHKLAVAPVAAGEKVIKYGLPIGSATVQINPGDRVHTHNLKSDYLPTYTLDGSNPYLPQAGDREQTD